MENQNIFLHSDIKQGRTYTFANFDGYHVLMYSVGSQLYVYQEFFPSLTATLQFFLKVSSFKDTSVIKFCEKSFDLACSMAEKEYENIYSLYNKARSIVRTQKGMKTGNVAFSFRKANGDIRRALGTLINIPSDQLPKGNIARKKNPLQIIFFDVEKAAYRSFNAFSFLY